MKVNKVGHPVLYKTQSYLEDKIEEQIKNQCLRQTMDETWDKIGSELLDRIWFQTAMIRGQIREML